MINTNATHCFGALGEISTSEKEGLPGQEKVMVDDQSFPDGYESCFFILSELYVDIDIDFHQLWGKTVTLVGWFHTIDGQCTGQMMITPGSTFSPYHDRWIFSLFVNKARRILQYFKNEPIKLRFVKSLSCLCAVVTKRVLLFRWAANIDSYYVEFKEYIWQ